MQSVPCMEHFTFGTSGASVQCAASQAGVLQEPTGWSREAWCVPEEGQGDAKRGRAGRVEGRGKGAMA
jgi:hypothetical protein